MWNRSQVAWISLLLSVIAMLAVLGTSGCEPQLRDWRTEEQEQGQFFPTVLFTDHQGCTVSRFRDHGGFHYYATCPDGSASTGERVHCGKNCTREVEVPTVLR